MFFAQSATMVDYKDRLAEAMRDRSVSASALAKQLKISYQAVKKVLDGKSGAFTASNNDEAAAFLSVSSRWLSRGVGPKHLDAGADLPATMTVAHQMSDFRMQTVSPLTWEQLMSEDRNGTLAESFIAVAPDDAMAPLARAGHEFLFRKATEAKPGAGIIVRDGAGGLYLRQLRQSETPGDWIAAATNPNYRSFEHIKDGVQIVAVLRAPMRGWEDL